MWHTKLCNFCKCAYIFNIVTINKLAILLGIFVKIVMWFAA